MFFLQNRFGSKSNFTTAEMSALCRGLMDLLVFISNSIDPVRIFYLWAICATEHLKISLTAPGR